MTKTVAILGATGSVGRQALDVARARGYNVDFICAGSDAASLEDIAREFMPRAVALADSERAKELKAALSDTNIKVYSTEEGIVEGIHQSSSEVVVNAILGEAGLVPSLAVIDSGKRLALANKESLVIAGERVTSRAKDKGVEIIPVDSEHSAIFQSLKAGRREELKRIILTASGGPFYGYTRDMLSRVTLADTLAHPTWKMGRKITVDSATLMNKGFEVIEAAHLFSVPVEDISVTIHRQSILHSAVEYIDNSIIGEFSVPDMRMCVQYAVDYPNREATHVPALDLFSMGALTFAAPDTEAFPFLALAKEAMSLGGAMPAIMNALDEVAVGAFLEERIGFLDIYEVVMGGFYALTERKAEHSLEGIIAADREARRVAERLIAKI